MGKLDRDESGPIFESTRHSATHPYNRMPACYISLLFSDLCSWVTSGRCMTSVSYHRCRMVSTWLEVIISLFCASQSSNELIRRWLGFPGVRESELRWSSWRRPQPVPLCLPRGLLSRIPDTPLYEVNDAFIYSRIVWIYPCRRWE